MSEHRKAIVDAFLDGYEGSLVDLAIKLGIPVRDVRAVTVPLMTAGFVRLHSNSRFVWNGTTRKKMA